VYLLLLLLLQQQPAVRVSAVEVEAKLKTRKVRSWFVLSATRPEGAVVGAVEQVQLHWLACVQGMQSCSSTVACVLTSDSFGCIRACNCCKLRM
jgi:hypothetical protein